MPPPPSLAGRLDYSPASARAWAAGWDYATARAAVDAHLRGAFGSSYQLAIDLNRHPAVIAARRQRRSAITALPWILRGPERAPHRYETDDAVRAWGMIQPLLGEITDDIAVMGLAVLEHPLDVVETETGPRYRVAEVRLWPLSCVEHGSAILARDADAGPYDPDRYYARLATPDTDTGRLYIPLPDPGSTDGHFTVIGEQGRPHHRGAVIACDLEYVAAQLARRAWARLQHALGKASVVGEMPAEIPIRDPDGGLNQVATDFQRMLEALGETQIAGIRPAGSKIDMIEVTAQTATLLPDSIDASVRMFALAILGHDAGLTRGTSVYADPKSQSVTEDLNRDTARTIVAGIEATVNFVASLNCIMGDRRITLDPKIPDSDQDMRREAVQKRRAADDEHAAAQLAAGKAAAEQVTAERAAGLDMTQARIATIYMIAGVPVPSIAETAPRGAEVYAYDLDGGIVTVNEQRADKGKPAVAWGEVTVPEYKARVAAGWTTSPAGWRPPPAAPAPTGDIVAPARSRLTAP